MQHYTANTVCTMLSYAMSHSPSQLFTDINEDNEYREEVQLFVNAGEITIYVGQYQLYEALFSVGLV